MNDGTAPLLYGEQDLVPVDGCRHGGMPGIVNDLLLAGSAERREQLVRGMLHDIGFEWMGYGGVLLQRNASVARSFLTTYAHAGWTERYFAERYHDVDPRHQDAPRSSLPLVWDMSDIEAALQARPATVRARRFFEDLQDSGIRSGVFLHLMSPAQSNQRTVVSLLSTRPNRGWVVDSVLGQSLTLVLCLHEFLTRHVQRRDVQATAGAGLSDLQQDILRRLSRGQSDKEIAHGMHLSSHTVDYHMRQLRRRFAARNRVQLVNAAM